MDKSSKALKMLLAIDDEMDESLCSIWIGKLVSMDKNPEHYADAFAYKCRTKDTPHKFFAWMLREDMVEDVCGRSVLMKAGFDKKRPSRGWPYPRGVQSCTTCAQAAGWFPVVEGRETDEQLAAIEAHEAQDLKTLVSGGAQIFLCLKCNPTGLATEEFKKHTYPAYPVGANPPPSAIVTTL